MAVAVLLHSQFIGIGSPMSPALLRNGRSPTVRLFVRPTQATSGKEQKPSIFELEQAIGVRDTSNSDPFKEGSAEKQLRETGEWLLSETDTFSRTAGKQILVGMFVWVLPVCIVALLVASGIIHLPFPISFLDDLLY